MKVIPEVHPLVVPSAPVCVLEHVVQNVLDRAEMHVMDVQEDVKIRVTQNAWMDVQEDVKIRVCLHVLMVVWEHALVHVPHHAQ